MLRSKAWIPPLLGLAALAGPASPAAAAPVSLRSGVLDTGRPLPELPKAVRARPVGAGEDEIALVQFPGPVTAAQIAALRTVSRQVYTYLPFHAFLVKLPAGTAKSRLAALGVSWSGPFHPAYKIAPEIAALTAADGKGSQDQRPVMLHLLPDADLDGVLGEIKALGGEPMRSRLARGLAGARRGAFFSRVRLLLTPAEIAALRAPLAGLRDVFWIELEPRKGLLNDTSIWVGQSGLAGGQATPIFDRGLLGEGQTVAIVDTGIDADSCFFREPGLGLPPVNACDGGTAVDPARRKILAVDFLAADECAGEITGTEWDTHGHGTHVAGTVAGDDLANPLAHDAADGMAPGARLIIQDAGYQVDPCADLPGLGCPVIDLQPIFQQAYDQGARIHTNSWGDNENGAVQNNYTAASQDVDRFLWQHKDDLIFFGAGNAGPGAGSVGSPSTNKNGLSVGATLRGGSADGMASFSSCGPTADGRIKPDLTLPGSSIVSAGNDNNVATGNCGTAVMSGTSMASPGAAGLAALARQYYVEGRYPTGVRNSRNRLSPSGALLKATLVNSAVNMEGTAAIPANCQGWGRILLDNALYFAGDARRLWIKDDAAPFPTGSTRQERTYPFTVDDGSLPLKVTLAWTDFPSTPAADPNLNNDLDLIVAGPGGTFLGNVFAGGVSTAGGTADRRNPLEQVLLDHPARGAYTVTVRSFEVPNGPQPFALVVTGGMTAACGGPADCSDGLFCNGVETCDAGVCRPGRNPCQPLLCNESTDSCYAPPTTVTFTSIAAQDGWVVESSETSGRGGTVQSAGVLRVGDDGGDRQIKAIVAFDTSAIPDSATLISATVRLRRGSATGTPPFVTHGACRVDVKTGGFAGSTALEPADFQAPATAVQAARLTNATTQGAWAEGRLNAAGLAAIDKRGTTELRLSYPLDDNDDQGADDLAYLSGDDAVAANRPQLVVTYQ